MIWALLFAAVVTVQSLAAAQAAAAPAQEGQRQPPPEVRKVPKDSLELLTAGCLKGRVFTSIGRREEESPVIGPNVAGLSFRLAGKKEVMKQVKEHDGHLVEVRGLVLKSALAGPGPGLRIGNTRIGVGAGRDPLSGDSRRTPESGVPVMDITSVRMLDSSCPIERK